MRAGFCEDVGKNDSSRGVASDRVPRRGRPALRPGWAWALLLLITPLRESVAESALVFQTDFGLKDGAVAAMRGTAVGVDPRIVMHDLSHENTPFNIWEAAYRLKQTAPFWPKGTVFVSVVDPGVGTERKSIVAKTRSGHYFVTPDNGTLTLVAEELGLAAVREIDETRHRREGSNRSYTFHGRDVYALVGARLAAGQLAFEDVGPVLTSGVVVLAHPQPRREGDALVGTIPFLDFQFGNVWTDLNEALFAQLGPKFGESFRVTISRAGRPVFTGVLPYARTFGDLAEGAPLLYLNSLLNVSFALSRGDFARTHGIACGMDWGVRVEKVKP